MPNSDHNRATRTFDAMLTLASGMALQNMDWRVGQCLLSALYRVRPAMADEIRGTYLDPFDFDRFIDDAVVLFLAWAEDALDRADGYSGPS